MSCHMESQAEVAARLNDSVVDQLTLIHSLPVIWATNSRLSSNGQLDSDGVLANRIARLDRTRKNSDKEWNQRAIVRAEC